MRTTRLTSCIAAFSTVALAGLAASGCSSNSSPSAGAPAAATTGSAPTGLAAKLLTAKDLPNGWGADVTPSEAPASTTCPLLNSPLWNSSLPEHAEADLSRGLTGPYLVEQIAAGTAAQADSAWKVLADGIPECTTYTHKGTAGQSTFAMAQTSKLPSYGDRSFAFTLDITITGGVNASGNILAARSGNSIVVVYLEGITGVSQADVEDIAGKAVAKART